MPRLDRCPQIRLTPEERAQYDQAARKFLRDTMVERAKFRPKHVDPTQWAFVKRRQQMRIFNSVLGSSNAASIIMVGTGLIAGRLEDVMGGLYCETTDELRTAKVLLGYALKDGSVLNASERRSAQDPYRFAGIKWFAGKCAWGLLHDRDVLTYERMGTTTDANGVELTYHTLQSIRRPEWPSEATPGMLRQHTATCYLYRRHKRTNETEIFLWGSILKFGSAPEKVIQLGVASTWLNVVYSPRGGQAKTFSALMDEAESHQWMPSSKSCHVCMRKPMMASYSQCAGCHQTVCRDCSEKFPIFALDKAGKAKKKLFCAFCIEKATGRPPVLKSDSKSLSADFDASECSMSGTESFSTSSSRSGSFRRPADPFRPRVSPSDDEDFPEELEIDW